MALDNRHIVKASRHILQRAEIAAEIKLAQTSLPSVVRVEIVAFVSSVIEGFHAEVIGVLGQGSELVGISWFADRAENSIGTEGASGFVFDGEAFVIHVACAGYAAAVVFAAGSVNEDIVSV